MEYKILIVDDEPNNLQLLRQILKDQYTLAFAKNGQEAIRITGEQQPDLILLDVMMPDMDGHEVCMRLKGDPLTNAIPIIFVTALDSTSDEQAGFDLGAVDYVSKPVSAPVVRARVKTHLRLYHQKIACEETVLERTAELRETRLRVIQHLGRAAEFKDNETGLHVIRMSHYSRIIAESLGWEEHACDTLLQAAPMHDVGKIGIPDHILRKPGPLDDEEWQVMRTHPQMGADILSGDNDELLRMARVIALHHHEKWDGSGYPNGVAGEDIPIEARIITIADVFDALTTKRPYKEAWSTEEAVEILVKDSGSHFDGRLVQVFIDSMPKVLEIKERWAEESAS